MNTYHDEYNSYKHGLRSFVRRQRLEAFDDIISEKIMIEK
jgi:hypothetical protein